METVNATQVATASEASEEPLPPRIAESLGELVGAAREGLMAFAVAAGLEVMQELIAEEVEGLVGPKGKHDPGRSAVRHGSERGSVTLGGRRLRIRRPRVRRADDSAEVKLSTYEHFASRDPLAKVVLERMLAGVSCRRYPRTQEPVGSEVEAEAASVSRSALSRTFVERTREALSELMGRRLDDVRLAVLMVDGIELKGRINVVALGITTEGVKVPLGLWEGSTENAAVATALLADLVERGLETSQGVLVVLDGAKALRRAVRDVLGDRAPVQRCIRHKERNVLAHVPERDRGLVKRRLAAAWKPADYETGLGRLRELAEGLERTHPGAAASLREGMEETLTLRRLGVDGRLWRTLSSTNPIESMIECVRRTQRNVKRWRDGEMAMRWTAAGMLEAERQFRRIIGYRELGELALAVENEVADAPPPSPTREEVRETVTV